jgi:putative oxidoreductase
MSGRKTGWMERVALNLLRIVTGLLFFQHGAQKLFGVLGREAPVEFFTLMGLAGILETVGGALLVLGLFTRPVAFILSGQMAWAYFSSHAPNGFWPIVNRGELSALYSFVFLYLAARGGGAFGIDGLLSLRKRRGGSGDEGGVDSGVPVEEKPKKEEKAKKEKQATPPEDDFPELTEEDLAEDPEIAELLGDNP